MLDINQATLSGSCDIICVKRLDKLASSDSTPKYIYKSTPFHIRFGKVKLLKSREKVVSVYVNGVLSNLTMKLSSAGEAYFPKDIDVSYSIILKSYFSKMFIKNTYHHRRNTNIG